MYTLLTDESLQEAYQEAVRMQLEATFVDMLLAEIEYRRKRISLEAS
ncbi:MULTISPECIES: sporulation histidine kinase inhibitor Sda [Paenibacillus]|uniref:Sporulation histidine kinase inhibitor Sda n=3 Tax=Paenibacillus TaxID=44249 RepID=A0AAJ2JZA2_9BACL|nr:MULTISPECIES: sporulation histidine kinase inhibitor Sda [Paenibacillus]MDT8977199.1 sporulation histidine kinase inhibitor Sda [Paenibacillus sp. chi10]TQR45430.1 sporulation histidine kinase inhibitor Sda [Paenibacillus sp. SDF0028]